MQMPAAIDRAADRNIGSYPARSSMAPAGGGLAHTPKAQPLTGRQGIEPLSRDRAEARLVCTGGHAAGKTESRKGVTMIGPTADLRGGCGKAFETGGPADGLKARDPAFSPGLV